MFASQCRTARAILGISVEELAEMAEVSPDAVIRLETDALGVNALIPVPADATQGLDDAAQKQSAKVQGALEARGIAFTYGDRLGVRFMTLDGIIEVSAAPAKL